MLNQEDKKWMLQNFATKGELNQLRDETKSGFDRIEVVANKAFTASEKALAKIVDLERENKAGAETMRRHTVQIEMLAKASGAALPE